MRRLLLLVLSVTLLWSGAAFAATLQVAQGVITTQVVNRMPVDEIQNYAASVGKLYCFTRIVGATEDTSVTHVWMLNDHEVARVTLPVRSSDWRTWSSKTIPADAKGQWQVKVLDARGDILKTIKFTLK
ncbi:MAG TPA: DUF2914 domain-containing protein [Desulfuromonadales bacterium]|nr:DUF2914 domain-containing protein [Desulfuromonadales bacterium]